jgi:hypothetical protein
VRLPPALRQARRVSLLQAPVQDAKQVLALIRAELLARHPRKRDQKWCRGQRYARYTDLCFEKGCLDSLEQLADLQEDDFAHIASRCSASTKAKDLRAGAGEALRVASALGLLAPDTKRRVDEAAAACVAAARRRGSAGYGTRFRVEASAEAGPSALHAAQSLSGMSKRKWG